MTLNCSGLSSWRCQLSLRECVRGSCVFHRLRGSVIVFEGQWSLILLTNCLADAALAESESWFCNSLSVMVRTLLFGLSWLTPVQHPCCYTRWPSDIQSRATGTGEPEVLTPCLATRRRQTSARGWSSLVCPSCSELRALLLHLGVFGCPLVVRIVVLRVVVHFPRCLKSPADFVSRVSPRQNQI